MPLGTRHRHVQVVCLCNGSRHEAPTELVEQSLRLLHGVGRTEADSRCVLVAAAGTPVKQDACRQAPRTRRWCAFTTEAAMKLRLTESSFALLHGARRKPRWPTQGACSSPGTRHVQVVCLCNGSYREAPTDRVESSLRLLLSAKRRPTQGLACSSLPLARRCAVESACRQDPERHVQVV